MSDELRRAEDILAEMRRPAGVIKPPSAETSPTDVPGTVARIVATVLGSDRVDLAIAFGHLGGDSLSAVRILSHCWRDLGVELPLRTLGPTTTVADLVVAVQAELAAGKTAFPTITARQTRADHTMPTSAHQRALVGLHAIDPAASTYHVSVELDLSGPLDRPRLHRAFTALVDRHEALRTVFDVRDGRISAQLAAPAVVDYTEITADPGTVAAVVRETAKAALDLTVSPVRGRLLAVGPNRHRLVVVVHHAVCDGLSMRILLRDLLLIYRQDDRAALMPLAVGASDVADWAERRLTQQTREDLGRAWQELLRGAPEASQLPMERVRPARQDPAGARVAFRLGPDTTERLTRLAAGSGTTLFAVLSSALAMLLRRYTGQRDMLLGFPVTGRHPTEGVVGYFSVTVPMRLVLDDRSDIAGLLRRTHESILAAHEIAALPFDSILRASGHRRDPSYHPLFQVAVALLSKSDDLPDLAGLRVRRTDVGTGTTKFDLSWYFEEVSQGLDGYLEFATGLFSTELAARLVADFQRILIKMTDTGALASAVAEPDSDQVAELVAELNGPVNSAPWAPAHVLFERHAAARPDHPALWHDGVEISYRDLDTAAGRLANRLRQQGIGAEGLVGICVRRSPAQITAVLGVLKAGAAYLPLDPEYPDDRLDYMLRDSRVRLVVTGQERARWFDQRDVSTLLVDEPNKENFHRNDSGGGEPPVAPRLEWAEDQLAYVIYTSGSTGRPKGVELTHRGMANVVANSGPAFGIEPNTRVLQFVSFSFDASVWEIFMALGFGATLCLGPPNQATAEQSVEQIIATCRASLVYLPPALLEVVDPDQVPTVDVVITGGDRVPAELRDRWLAHCRFFAAYGPTEGTIVQTWIECRRGEHGLPTIGAALDNVRLYVLDATLRPVPRGAIGEVFVGGAAVSRGYRFRPGLTARKFLPDPYAATPGSRMYRTGDLVRRRLDGALEFAGRVDHQVKIRGFRIELGEVEAALRALPEVRAALVRPERAPSGRDQLVGYVVPTESANGAELGATLRQALRTRLPDHLVPSRLHVVPVFPLTPNGKVDVPSLQALVSVDIKSLTDVLDKIERLSEEEARALLRVMEA